MSSALAIAGVTAVLRDLLNDGFVNNDVNGIVGGNVEVSALAPDRVFTDGGLEQPRLNIYMYLVTPNNGWRNECLPSINNAGHRVNNPPLALDMHYLITAYGVEDLQAEILIGYAMQLLHENPVLHRDAINTALNPAPDVGAGLPPALQALSDSGLADQVEQIKFTPEYLNTEEMSKFWTAAQSNYRPTAAYLATVALIESEQPVRSALPVRDRTLKVIPFQRPHINSVSPERIEAGNLLTLHGQNLAGEITNLRIGASLITPDNVTNRQITLTLPETLNAGIQGVQVVHEINLGIPEEPHRGVESNIVPFVLQPLIETAAPINATPGGALTLEVAPPVTSAQKISALIGEQEIKMPLRPEGDPAITELTFSIPEDFENGSFLLRVRIDGAESSLTIEDNQYTGPTVTIS